MPGPTTAEPCPVASVNMVNEDAFGVRPRRSCRDKKPVNDAYSEALDEELRMKSERKERRREAFKQQRQELREQKEKEKSEKRERKQKRRRQASALTTENYEADEEGDEEGTDARPTYFEEDGELLDLKQLDEDTIRVQNEQLSPSMRESGLACVWEFACVLDFFQRFGREAYQRCVECYQQHLKHERLRWHPDDVAIYDDNRIFNCCFFTADQLLNALETRYSADGLGGNTNYWMLVDIHVMLLKGMHPRSRNPPCRMNWVEYLKTKVMKRWDEVVCGPPPSAFEAQTQTYRETRLKEEFDEYGNIVIKEEIAEEDEVEALDLFALYNNMTSYEKLQCLRFLCELYCEIPTVSKRIDTTVSNTNLPRKIKEMAENKKVGETLVTSWNKKEIKITGPMEYVDDMRLSEPFAKDFYGRQYWLIQLYPEQGHCFLVREQKPFFESSGSESGQGDLLTMISTSAAKKGSSKSKQKKKRGGLKIKLKQYHLGSKVHPPSMPTYEVVCAEGEEFIKFVDTHVDATLFGAKTRQKFREGDVYHSIVTYKEQMAKVKAAQERLRSQLGSNVGHYTEGAYEGGRSASARVHNVAQYEDGTRRSRRRTQAVSYAEMENNFDSMIDDAIKEQQNQRLSSRVRKQRPIRDWTDDEEMYEDQPQAKAPAVEVFQQYSYQQPEGVPGSSLTARETTMVTASYGGHTTTTALYDQGTTTTAGAAGAEQEDASDFSPSSEESESSLDMKGSMGGGKEAKEESEYEASESEESEMDDDDDSADEAEPKLSDGEEDFRVPLSEEEESGLSF